MADLSQRIQTPLSIEMLSPWRRVWLFSIAAFAITTTAVSVYLDFAFYADSPDHPVPSRGQIFPINVMHGYVRYLTSAESDRFAFWTRSTGTLTGMVMLLWIFLWFTTPRTRNGRNS